MAKILILGGGFGGVAAAEITGAGTVTRDEHEITPVVDEGGKGSVDLRRKLCENDRKAVRHGRFRSWAERANEQYFRAQHSWRR